MTVQAHPKETSLVQNSRLDTSALHQIIVIARLTFREAQRRRLLWLGLGLGLAFVALFCTGFYFVHQDVMTEEAADIAAGAGPGVVDYVLNLFLMAGLYVVNFLVIMVTVLTTVGTLSAEVDSNTIHSIAAKPIRRWQIVLGKWIGHAVMLIAYTLLMSVGLMIGVYLIGGYIAPNAISGLAILLLESLVILSITMLGGARFSTLANGVVVFMLYGLAFVGGWVEQIGSLLGSDTAVNIGIASSLLQPSEALWRFAAGVMQPDSVLGIELTPFSVTSQPTPAFLVYAILYTLVGLFGAMWVFSKRDF